MTPGHVTPEILREWWWHRQGLDGTLDGSTPATVLTATGWARTVGSANSYLTLFARAGSGRAEVDAATADLAICELPAARGCTYLVPAADFGLALQAGWHAPEAEAVLAERLGVRRAELDTLCDDVVAALSHGPLDPARLRDVLGSAVRSLGEEGRKKGLSTTLPIALGLLQAAGRIRRIPVNGRLDQQRYVYTRWSPIDTGLSDEEARTELARKYFGWTGGHRFRSCAGSPRSPHGTRRPRSPSSTWSASATGGWRCPPMPSSSPTSYRGRPRTRCWPASTRSYCCAATYGACCPPRTRTAPSRGTDPASLSASWPTFPTTRSSTAGA